MYQFWVHTLNHWSISAVPLRMKEELAVSLGAKDRRIDHLNILSSKRLHDHPQAVDSIEMSGFIAHDAAFANPFSAHLELRLDEENQSDGVACEAGRDDGGHPHGGTG